jgi:hypothetical protein
MQRNLFYVSQACGLLWNCNDILPGVLFRDVEEVLGVARQTYAAVAQAHAPLHCRTQTSSFMRIVMANSMKIALALLALSFCAGCAPYYHDHYYADGYYEPRRHYVHRYKPRTYYHRTRYRDNYDDRRRHEDGDRRDRPLSERYDNRDCHATRDGRVKCYYD